MPPANVSRVVSACVGCQESCSLRASGKLVDGELASQPQAAAANTLHSPPPKKKKKKPSSTARRLASMSCARTLHELLHCHRNPVWTHVVTSSRASSFSVGQPTGCSGIPVQGPVLSRGKVSGRRTRPTPSLYAAKVGIDHQGF